MKLGKLREKYTTNDGESKIMNILTNYKWSRIFLGNDRLTSVKYAITRVFKQELDVKSVFDRSKEITKDRETVDTLVKSNFKMETPYIAPNDVSVSKMVENIRTK